MIIHRNKLFAFPEREICLFPGSFNPIHEGHLEIVEKISQKIRTKPTLEIALVNADKGVITAGEAFDRIVKAESHNLPAIVTSTKVFGEKIKFWGEYTEAQHYILGTDTWARLHTPGYFDLNDLYELIREKNVRFSVFNRDSALFKDYGMNVEYYEEFNKNISSTKIREAKKNLFQ